MDYASLRAENDRLKKEIRKAVQEKEEAVQEKERALEQKCQAELAARQALQKAVEATTKSKKLLTLMNRCHKAHVTSMGEITRVIEAKKAEVEGIFATENEQSKAVIDQLMRALEESYRGA
jgi:cysteinyl-tRNA synthetase